MGVFIISSLKQSKSLHSVKVSYWNNHVVGALAEAYYPLILVDKPFLYQTNAFHAFHAPCAMRHASWWGCKRQVVRNWLKGNIPLFKAAGVGGGELEIPACQVFAWVGHCLPSSRHSHLKWRGLNSKARICSQHRDRHMRGRVAESSGTGREVFVKTDINEGVE